MWEGGAVMSVWVSQTAAPRWLQDGSKMASVSSPGAPPTMSHMRGADDGDDDDREWYAPQHLLKML